MLQGEKYPISIPIHQSGPSLNCPLVDNRCDHCGVSILAHPDIQMDEIMSSRDHQETADETTLPPPPYQLIGDGTPHPTPVPSEVEGPSAPPRLEDDGIQPSSALAASRRNRRRRRLRIRITLRFKIGSAREREKTVTFL
ncbi:unnamed protein product [Clonostachys rhizophaga]|uniref:Uncharacterized protein n=1 Tax=Clonostachys rhizophaga TaxID=160324 RepID=A0A9N9V4Q6_9HYPO|nr:unnamed protein product [Clonostachys rhizophaga]